jgi:predicted GNAT superfamily acetyltransferase
VTSAITIRPFSTVEEYQSCVELQEDTWGEGFSERVPPAILKVAQMLGGVSAGAYNASGTLVGFVFGMTGPRNGEVVHWSDMLAVRSQARDTGLGLRLKEYQRDAVMARGVDKMYWTFDPLQSRNAHLNIAKLGAVVRDYATDMYGQTDSPLHRGIGTDRFVALWLLSSARVCERLASGGFAVVPEGMQDSPFALDTQRKGLHPSPGTPDLTLGNDEVRVSIPSDITALMDDEVGLAREWRSATRSVFTHYLMSGYEVRGFARGPSVSYYLLARYQDDE